MTNTQSNAEKGSNLKFKGRVYELKALYSMVFVGNYSLPTYHELGCTLIGGSLCMGRKQVMDWILIVLISFE
jgi:hypothetical protein